VKTERNKSSNLYLYSDHQLLNQLISSIKQFCR